MLADPGLNDDLTTWRNQSMPFFLTQFSGTEDRTQRWLETISLPAADRILGRIFGRRSTGGKCRVRLSEDGASGRTFPAALPTG
ncbi:hypothetical protein [Rhizobium leguminosarum]|uniref:hypothetical protein n=1 Tax=Rhizobium leguminosarum TaxID=384 RepID=UPI001FDA6BD5|nr:hypothetical protein [Rhizobium leguminosarum]